MIATDGSKEGWPESCTGDQQRDLFVQWCNDQRWSDGSSSLRWVEVQYGDDDGITKIVRDEVSERSPTYYELHEK